MCTALPGAQSARSAARRTGLPLTEAAKAKDEYMMKLALDNLIQRYASKNKEKVEKYITFARQYLPEEHNTLFRYYLYCYNIWA